MIASIGKFSKSFLAKILVAIIALPFVMWGMGDVFRSGNQNVIAEINEHKISTKEFMEYLQEINLSRDEIKKKGKEVIINEVLTNYISEKIISIETKEKGILLTDTSLKNILISDDGFKKNGKFLRTKYEKFLLEKGLDASRYERNIFNLETKGQLLSYYSGGIKLPNFLVDELFQKENKSIRISFIDLTKVYSNEKITDEKINNFYEKNKGFFKDKFRSFRYLELTPNILIGKKDFDEAYFEKIDEIENKILDGEDFNNITSFATNKIKEIPLINSNNFKRNGDKYNLDKKLLDEIFKIENLKSPEFINFENQFYIVEVEEESDSALNLKNENVKNTIIDQLKVVNLIEKNSLLNEKIINKKFGKNEMIKLSEENNIPLEVINIKNINDSTKFNNRLLKQIYNHNRNQIFIISDYPKSKKNFLIKIEEENYVKIDRDTAIYKEYIKKSNANYISKVYKSYDNYINEIYKINLNEKVLERLINSI